MNVASLLILLGKVVLQCLSDSLDRDQTHIRTFDQSTLQACPVTPTESKPACVTLIIDMRKAKTKSDCYILSLYSIYRNSIGKEMCLHHHLRVLYSTVTPREDK